MPAIAESAPAKATAESIDYALVRPYEVGQIMIIMYHGLVETEAEEETYQRSVENFKNDLQTFYDRGFRLISMKDWLDNNIMTPAGRTPLILTFDDGKASAFSLEDRDGALRPVKDCAVDIMTQFSEQHPDFGNTAMFFINKNPFKGDGSIAERFKYLLDHGYELGNHTMNHTQMSKLDAAQIQEEIGGIDKLIKENAPGYEPFAFSYPFGERPLKDLRGYVQNGVWEGNIYHYEIAVREGQSGPPSAVNRTGFDTTNVPRVRGSSNQETDMGWTLKQYETDPELRYVSDGIPDRIAVPKEYADNVDESSLNGKELFLY
jgi:peptidoglycan/xylan/chitin deacetylase (PgdA/CDA1 family)